MAENGGDRMHCHTRAPLIATLLAFAASAAAQQYPTKPLRIIVMNTPGSGADIVTRLIAAKLSESLGQQVVVDNRAGASGNIGAEIAARAAPDGYTLAMITSQQPNVVALYDKKLPYDLVKDFAPISLLASAPYFIVVHPSVAATNIRELVALAKSKPGALSYGSAGSGSAPHLATEVFKSMAGINMLHVPYKGTTPALTDTMAGQIQLTVLVAPLVLPAVKAGKVRALGVTSNKRSALAPEIPTVAESVPGYEWSGWYGLTTPAKTPASIIARLNAEQNQAIKDPNFKERLAGVGAEPIGSTPAEYGAHIKTQLDKMRLAIKLAVVKVE
jgi:tripartite-type tricarboxylate transporter receptor subunit TctC